MAKLFSSKSKTTKKLPSGSDLLKTIRDFLDDRKAEDVVTISLRGKSNLFDHMVVASGSSQRHIHAIAEDLVTLLKSKHGLDSCVEGLNHCDWVLVDAGDVIVHVFRPEVRAFYHLERMWDHGLDGQLASGPVA